MAPINALRTGQKTRSATIFLPRKSLWVSIQILILESAAQLGILVENKAARLGVHFYPAKCESIWYISKNPDWYFKIAGEDTSWKASVKYLWVRIEKILNFKQQAEYVRQKTDWKINLLNVLSSVTFVNTRILKNVYTATIKQPWSTKQWHSEWCTNYRSHKTKGTPNHPFHATINRRQIMRNVWATRDTIMSQTRTRTIRQPTTTTSRRHCPIGRLAIRIKNRLDTGSYGSI